MTGELAGMGWYGMVMTLPCGDWERVSSMTRQICLTHLVTDCGMPAMVMACRVELGSIFSATWTWPLYSGRSL